MKHLKTYCRGRAWCADLKVAATFLALAAIGAFVVLQVVPANLIGY